MGLMPPYDPFADPSLLWAVARVLACEPTASTWGRPAAVTLEVERALRLARLEQPLPRTLSVLFSAPREAAQEQFYATRDANPEQANARLAELQDRPIEIPAAGQRVIVWLTPPLRMPPAAPPPGPAPSVAAPDSEAPGAPSPPQPPGVAALPPAPPGGFWEIPTLRLFPVGPPGSESSLPMRSRWIEHSADVEAEVSRRLGVA